MSWIGPVVGSAIAIALLILVGIIKHLENKRVERDGFIRDFCDYQQKLQRAVQAGGMTTREAAESMAKAAAIQFSTEEPPVELVAAEEPGPEWKPVAMRDLPKMWEE